MKVTRREFTLAVAPALLRAQQPRVVRARRKPTDEWREYPTRTLDDVAGFRPAAKPPETDVYGGRVDRKHRATGFFYPAKLGKRWWLIDPAGNPYLQAGICSLAPGKSADGVRNLKERFGTPEKWAAATSDLLRANGFTGSGGWSDVELLRTAPRRLVYSTTSNFMGDFGRAKKLTHQQSGHLGYANDCIPVFHPEFAASCDQTAKKLAATKDDSYLLGHFTDNELPAPVDLLDRMRKLDANDAGRKAAEGAGATFCRTARVRPLARHRAASYNQRSPGITYAPTLFYLSTDRLLRPCGLGPGPRHHHGAGDRPRHRCHPGRDRHGHQPGHRHQEHHQHE